LSVSSNFSLLVRFRGSFIVIAGLWKGGVMPIIFVVVAGGVAEVDEESIPSVDALKHLKRKETLEVEIIDYDNLKESRKVTMRQLSPSARKFVLLNERRNRARLGRLQSS
jgi:hypothetical protein